MIIQQPLEEPSRCADCGEPMHAHMLIGERIIHPKRPNDPPRWPAEARTKDLLAILRNPPPEVFGPYVAAAQEIAQRLEDLGRPTAGVSYWIAKAESLQERVTKLEETLEHAPIARVTVQDGKVTRTLQYTPGLPDGEHDLWCAPVGGDS